MLSCNPTLQGRSSLGFLCGCQPAFISIVASTAVKYLGAPPPLPHLHSKTAQMLSYNAHTPGEVSSWAFALTPAGPAPAPQSHILKELVPSPVAATVSKEQDAYPSRTQALLDFHAPPWLGAAEAGRYASVCEEKVAVPGRCSAEEEHLLAMYAIEQCAGEVVLLQGALLIILIFTLLLCLTTILWLLQVSILGRFRMIWGSASIRLSTSWLFRPCYELRITQSKALAQAAHSFPTGLLAHPSSDS